MRALRLSSHVYPMLPCFLCICDCTHLRNNSFASPAALKPDYFLSNEILIIYDIGQRDKFIRQEIEPMWFIILDTACVG